MPPRGRKEALSPEEQRRLIEDHKIFFDGILLPRDWPPRYREIFEKIRQIGRETYDDYGKDGRLDHRLTVLPNIQQIKRRAIELRRKAYGCRQRRENEDTWRATIETCVLEQFQTEVVCRTCRKRLWEADFQAAGADDLGLRRARRLPCDCSIQNRMRADMDASQLFLFRMGAYVLYHEEDQLTDKGIMPRKPDLIYGLEHTDVLNRLLPNSQTRRHSPYPDGYISYPFLMIEAKSEKGSPGFESVERQSAWPIRTLLKLQESLNDIGNGTINPLIWFLANQGDEWRVYACVVDESKYRIIDLWHGCMLSLDSAFQILLIADYICDWARDIFRPNVIRCLGGGDDLRRDYTPASIYPDGLNLNSTATVTSESREFSTFGGLNSITRRTHSLSLEPVLADIISINSDVSPIEDNDRSAEEFLDYHHPYLNFSRMDHSLPPWRQHATIRHSNMVLFSFHLFAIPEEPSHIARVFQSLGDEFGLDIPATCSHFLELLEDDQSVTVTMNAIYQLEGIWTERVHRLTSAADYPVRARVLFHTYLREDWQVIREIHCIVASRFAILALMHMPGVARSSPLIPAMLPHMTVDAEGIRNLRCFSGSYSLACALGPAYLRVYTKLSDREGCPPSWVSHSLNIENPLFEFEEKLSDKLASNPCSLKFEAVLGGGNVPSELEGYYGPATLLDRTGAVLIRKPLSWAMDSPTFCLMVLDDTSFTDPGQLSQKLSQTCEARNIYMTGTERENGSDPLSEVDQIGILRWIAILSGGLPEDSPWTLAT